MSQYIIERGEDAYTHKNMKKKKKKRNCDKQELSDDNVLIYG